MNHSFMHLKKNYFLRSQMTQLWIRIYTHTYTHTHTHIYIYIHIYTYCYGNGPYWTTKYRISSDPPLNACIARLFGKMDVICVSGGVRGCIIVVRWWWNESSLFFLPIPDEAPPSRLRGCGQKEEVKLRGGVCRLR